jgi:CBS domain-containing protein
MLVKDLMTRNVNSCRPENNLAELAKVMRKQRCGALPIVDGSGRVTGIITDRDICIALGMKNIRASDVRARDVSHTGCISSSPDNDLDADELRAREYQKMIPRHGLRYDATKRFLEETDMPTRTKTETVTRTDAEIARDIKRRMKTDIEVPDDRIGVRVTEGVVTIEGAVARDSQKTASETCSREVKGVRGIVNKITVEPAALPLEA